MTNMQHLTRRQFLKLTTISVITIWAYRVFAETSPEQTLNETYPAFLDTIIPRDQTPSATDLGIDQTILREIKTQTGQWNLCLLACISLQSAAQKKYQTTFKNLTLDQRESVLEKWLTDKTKQHIQTFFRFHRQRAMEEYYSHAESWPGLGFSRPPQPLGYADYHSAPQSNRV